VTNASKPILDAVKTNNFSDIHARSNKSLGECEECELPGGLAGAFVSDDVHPDVGVFSCGELFERAECVLKFFVGGRLL
jgi:hypothetical protein